MADERRETLDDEDASESMLSSERSSRFLLGTQSSPGTSDGKYLFFVFGIILTLLPIDCYFLCLWNKIESLPLKSDSFCLLPFFDVGTTYSNVA